jgi:hypothetical protein
MRSMMAGTRLKAAAPQSSGALAPRSLMRRWRGALALIGLVAAASPVLADWAFQNGGQQDLSTGLVWSQSQAAETGSWWTWPTSQTNAANYVTHDYDASGTVIATYADWRVPTVAELQTAIANGTMNQLVPRDPPLYAGSSYVWSSQSRGNKGWAVRVVRDETTGDVVAGGEAVLFLKGSGFEVFFVRP